MKGILVAICLFCAHSVFGREIALGTDEHLMAGGEAEELRGPFTLDEARVSTSWKDLNGKAPNYGFTREVIWLRLQIHSDEQTERILYLDGWADHLDIYTVHDGVTVYHDAGLKAISLSIVSFLAIMASYESRVLGTLDNMVPDTV